MKTRSSNTPPQDKENYFQTLSVVTTEAGEERAGYNPARVRPITCACFAVKKAQRRAKHVVNFSSPSTREGEARGF